MKPLALILLALTSGAEASAFTVREVKQPVYQCEVEKQPVSCAYLLALLRLIRDEQFTEDRVI